MTAIFPPKTSILFPNQWAVDSFLRKLKTRPDWEFKASSDERRVRVKPKGSADGILIGLNKGLASITLDLNGEKLPAGSDEVWKEIYEFANRYRC